MRAVGVREVKNKLSEYLGHVRRGEVVLITDRGKVIAQLAPPPVAAPPPLSEDAALGRLAAAGKVRLPRNRVPSPGMGPVPGVPQDIDVESALDAVRSDRREP